MTLQQLKYAITVAQTGTITEAAEKLYISRPSLTNAIHELEKEMNIEIFTRTNKGIIVSKDGEDFLGYARQVLEQAEVLEDKYKGGGGGKKKYCISGGTHWLESKLLQINSWKHIRICHMNRESTIRFIFQRKYFQLMKERKISG